MADFEQGTTERCSVCKTEYPTCMTCTKYGRNHKHSLDVEKSKNAHDNASFVNDAGKTQSHWNKTEKNNKSKHIILFLFFFTDKHVVYQGFHLLSPWN